MRQTGRCASSARAALPSAFGSAGGAGRTGIVASMVELWLVSVFSSRGSRVVERQPAQRDANCAKFLWSAISCSADWARCKERGLARCRACAAGVKGTAMQAYSCASACVAHGACTVAVEASAHCEGWPRPISSINQQRMTLFTTPRSRTGAPGPRVRRDKGLHAARVRCHRSPKSVVT